MELRRRRIVCIALVSFALFTTSVAPLLAADATVNFGSQIQTGSPLVFGGTQTPNWQSYQTLGWQLLQDYGVQFIRQDIHFESFITQPAGISVDTWKSNPAMRDPNNWHQGGMEYIANKFINARQRGMKTMLVMAYAPTWLTYNNVQNGVPKDWGVWQDMVKITIQHFKTKYGITFDYYEVWNEPGDEWFSDFFKLAGSPYASHSIDTRQNIAYADMFYYTQAAIKAVDPTAKIGGPADYQPRSTIKHLHKMFQDTRIRDKIDFVSFHFYDRAHRHQIPAGQNIIQPIADILNQYGKGNTPIMISEGNYTCCGGGGTNGTQESVSYWGDQFNEFFRTGLLAYGYFTTGSDLCSSNNLCFYKLINNTQATPQPEALTWRLISKKLGLGSGASKIMSTNHSSDIKALGAINSANQRVAFLSNNSATNKTATVTWNNVGLTGSVDTEVYLVKLATNDGATALSTQTQSVNNNSLSFNVNLPAWSVVGIKVANAGSQVPANTQSPYSGSAIALPGTIQAEDFDNGGEGVSFHETSAANEGGVYRNTPVDIKSGATTPIVGWFINDEWLEYTVNVTQPGTYRLRLRGGTMFTGRSFRITLDDTPLATVTLPLISSWNSHVEFDGGTVSLPAGQHVLRLALTGGDNADIDWLAVQSGKPADANGDGKVDGIDYVIWLTNSDKATSEGPAKGDFNSDSIVDGVDYALWLLNFGK